MVVLISVALITALAFITAVPLEAFDDGLKASDASNAARYNPDQDNVYHLFTRSNPTLSQPLLTGNMNLLVASNFTSHRRTVYLIHGGFDNVTAVFNQVLVPAYLQAEDVNVIAVDWGLGAFEGAVQNTVASGLAGARFINWLNSVTGASTLNYHIVGFSLGAHQAGVVGRNIIGNVSYVIALDPANGWQNNVNVFSSNAGIYTEAMHTNAGVVGIGIPIAHVDFYPNGGNDMPGCGMDPGCNHNRCVYYLAESVTSGGFTGRQCASYTDARAGNCTLNATLPMGGLDAKTGISGLFHVPTNAASPFSMG